MSCVGSCFVLNIWRFQYCFLSKALFILFSIDNTPYVRDANRSFRSSRMQAGTKPEKSAWNSAASRTTEEDIQETENIISEIVHKLKVWLRGYLSLMFIDFSVYSIAFYFLNVPYFLILGAIAGCGILLPFIGPILSASITCLVTLACGDASAMQLLGIIGIYLMHNGITEQFILYPSVIGESLGLTTLETIIVVLLGGIFAGATGMILSIPAAAVLKYLVPRIFHYWQPEKK